MRDYDCLSVRDGALHIEGVSTVDLAEQFGTPLFVFSEAQIRENLRRFREAFAEDWPGPVDVLPAMKANTLLATRQILSNEGAGADIYSPEELEGVLQTGVDPERVSVNGGGKPREHLRNCVDAGVRITIEDVDEADLIQDVAAELGKIAKVRFRVKPALPNLWRPTDFSQMTVPIDLGIQVYKSGVPPEYLEEMGHQVFAMPNVELVGLHFHAGRHHPSLWYWEGMMVRFARLVGELSRAWGGWQPSEIDIGGGMAAVRRRAAVPSRRGESDLRQRDADLGGQGGHGHPSRRRSAPGQHLHRPDNNGPRSACPYGPRHHTAVAR
jgi:diaminopimelate decarboxylase